MRPDLGGTQRNITRDESPCVVRLLQLADRLEPTGPLATAGDQLKQVAYLVSHCVSALARLPQCAHLASQRPVELLIACPF
jgi:hypothetical protein